VVCTASALSSTWEGQNSEQGCRDWSPQWSCTWEQAAVGFGDMGLVGPPSYGGGPDLSPTNFGQAGMPSPLSPGSPYWMAGHCAPIQPWSFNQDSIGLTPAPGAAPPPVLVAPASPAAGPPPSSADLETLLRYLADKDTYED